MLHFLVLKDHHQALKYTVSNISQYACRCFEIYEISQIFTNFYKNGHSTEVYMFHIPHVSSSCSGRIRFDSCSLYPQNKIGPSNSSSVVLCRYGLRGYTKTL